MENPISGYVIETWRVETWKFTYTFRFAANNNVPYMRAHGLSKNCFSTVVRIVSLGVLVPKFHGTRRIDLYSRTRFSTVLRDSGGSVAEWLRALDLKSGGPWFKSSTLLLSGFVLGSPEFNFSTVLCK